MTPTKYFLGIDPDLHSLAFAIVDKDLILQQAWVVRADGVLPMVRKLTSLPATTMAPALTAIEAQEIYLSGAGRTKNPRDILHLGQVAGACALAAYKISDDVIMPLPVQWKGNVPKIIHHRRILAKANAKGIGTLFANEKNGGYCGLDGTPFDILRGEWKHVTDAIGLAQYAATQYQNEKLMSPSTQGTL